jgi:ElaB/YqjD/DUF883 family membrane-anchored ribosome-binding protein
MSDYEKEDLAPDGRATSTGGESESAGRSSAVRSAADAVRQAEAELKKAHDFYEKARNVAAERLKAAREAKLGDLIDGILELVKKHPGTSVTAAGLIGFFLGNRLRR